MIAQSQYTAKGNEQKKYVVPSELKVFCAGE